MLIFDLFTNTIVTHSAAGLAGVAAGYGFRGKIHKLFVTAVADASKELAAAATHTAAAAQAVEKKVS